MTAPRESLASPRLWLAFATMLLVSGLANTFPVFFPPLLEEFRGSRGATASTASLIWMGSAALGPLAGYLIARTDPRALLTVGLGAMAAGLGLGATAPTLPLFILVVGVGGALGVGLTGLIAQAALIADAYVSRRGLAMGIAFSGSMAAFALAPPAQWAVTHLGWRGAFWGYAAAISALVPWVWAIHPRRLQARARAGLDAAAGIPTLGAIVGSWGFWSLALVFTTPPLFGYLATTQHMLYLTERGYSAGTASLLLALGGGLAGGGRALAGWVSDRFGGGTAGFLSFAASLLGMLCLLGMEVRPSALLAGGYVLFLFLPMGSRATIVSVLVSRIAPPVHYGLVFGLLGVGNSLGAAAGPWLSGALYDWTRSYLAIYLAATGIALLGLAALAVFALATRPRP